MMPGIGIAGSTMLTQKCGVTERLQLQHHADDADVGDARRSARAPPPAGPGRAARRSGVGTVQITASAGWKPPPAVSTPVTRPSSVCGSARAGSPRRIAPPRASIASHERLHQRLRAALDVAELLLQQRAARAADALDARPDPGGRDVVGVFVEFQVEQRPPEPVVDRLAAPALDPVLAEHVLQRSPVVAPRRDEHQRAVAELLEQARVRKAQQRDRIAPGVQRAVDEVAHRGRPPAHAGRRCRAPRISVEGRLVRLADEMVEALDRQAAEVEMRGHAARLRRRLEQRHLMPERRARDRPRRGPSRRRRGRRRVPCRQNSSDDLRVARDGERSRPAPPSAASRGTPKMPGQSMTSNTSGVTSASSCLVVKGGSRSNSA